MQVSLFANVQQSWTLAIEISLLYRHGDSSDRRIAVRCTRGSQVIFLRTVCSDRISLYSPSIFYSSVAQTATRERKKGSRVARRRSREHRRKKNPSGIITLSVTSCSISTVRKLADLSRTSFYLERPKCVIVHENNFRRTDIIILPFL